MRGKGETEEETVKQKALDDLASLPIWIGKNAKIRKFTVGKDYSAEMTNGVF